MSLPKIIKHSASVSPEALQALEQSEIGTTEQKPAIKSSKDLVIEHIEKIYAHLEQFKGAKGMNPFKYIAEHISERYARVLIDKGTPSDIEQLLNLPLDPTPQYGPSEVIQVQEPQALITPARPRVRGIDF